LSKLLLASRSPRRCELLNILGLPFIIDSFDVDESCEQPASCAVELLSLRKAEAARAKYPDYYILSADTLVSINGVSLGKPRDDGDARRMLHMLSGNTHQVYTGVTVISPEGESFTEHDCSNVTFVPITDSEIDSYIRSGEPMDKAGSYALQGRAAQWIIHMDGNPFSVIGLPLYLVRSLLLQSGYPFDNLLMKEQ